MSFVQAPHVTARGWRPSGVRGPAAVVLVVFTALALAGWLAGELLLPPVQSVDASAEGRLVASPGGAVDALTVLTWFGSATCLALVAIIIVAAVRSARRPRVLAFLALSGLGSAALSEIVKDLVDRPRPGVSLVGVSGFSFPSGHATESAAVYSAVAIVVMGALSNRRARLCVTFLACVLVAAIAWSRLALGVHYPADVVAGVIIGFVWTIACASATGLRPSMRRSP